MNKPLRIGVLGAGAIGCYLGGCLAAAGHPVTLIGRERFGRQLREHGLSVSDWQGRSQQVAADQVSFATDPAALADCPVVIVAVKGGDTASAAADLAAHTPPGTVVASYQNGVRNAVVLSSALPEHRVLAGMVPFNVVNEGQGRFHCGTEGRLALQQVGDAHAQLAAAFTDAQLPVDLYDDMLPVLWSKLILNLNNPINALSGKPLKVELETRGYRRVLAASIREANALLAAAKIKPARMGKTHPKLMPWVLGMPDGLFKVIAKGILQVDPKATSSMQEDLKAGKKTEIDFLNGELLHLAAQTGVSAPVNRAIVDLIREAEAANAGPPGISAGDLVRRVRV